MSQPYFWHRPSTLALKCEKYNPVILMSCNRTFKNNIQNTKKGKGSTCAFIESLLRHHGLKTGFFSSPHLVSVTERIRINSIPFDQTKFVNLFESTYDQLEPRERPAYFAFLALMAYKAFVEENVRSSTKSRIQIKN